MSLDQTAFPTTHAEPSLLYAYGFSSWKRKFVRRFIQQDIHFVYFGWQIPDYGTVVIWGSRCLPASVTPTAKIIRIEDGFLRSVGLGADLIQPLSWVIDHTGIYYDASRPSDLENILAHNQFDADILARAKALRERLIHTGLTKYNVGTGRWQGPKTTQKIILVPGQVESDASIRYGAYEIRRNIELLREVRKRNPKAYIVYKPHPDVVAGLRLQTEPDALQWCDTVVVNVSMAALLEQVDEVHVITSLTGFEALLRGKTVHCYGQPFYAGWGLTRDHHTHPRRVRKLALDELIAGSLILYPSYVSRETRELASPETVLDELMTWRAEPITPAVPLMRKVMRKVLSRV
jgi:capsular polysaccharide export protein